MKLTININDDDLAKLSKSYEDIGIEAIEMVKLVLLKKLSRMNIRGTIATNKIGADKKSNPMLEFNRKMKDFKILQNSIGIILGITQASISRALSNNIEKSLLFKEILKKGDKILIDAYILQNCKHVKIGNIIAPRNTLPFIKALIHNLDEKQSYEISLQKLTESELFGSIDFDKLNSDIKEFISTVKQTTKIVIENKLFTNP